MGGGGGLWGGGSQTYQARVRNTCYTVISDHVRVDF